VKAIPAGIAFIARCVAPPRSAAQGLLCTDYRRDSMNYGYGAGGLLLLILLILLLTGRI
jgi:hypothetical protein